MPLQRLDSFAKPVQHVAAPPAASGAPKRPLTLPTPPPPFLQLLAQCLDPLIHKWVSAVQQPVQLYCTFPCLRRRAALALPAVPGEQRDSSHALPSCRLMLSPTTEEASAADQAP